MNFTILVQIVGAPVACKQGVKESWRDVARWVEGQLKGRFGQVVQVKYYDLFDVDRPPLPAGAKLPMVWVNNDVTVNGGRISVPDILRKIEIILAAGTAGDVKQ